MCVACCAKLLNQKCGCMQELSMFRNLIFMFMNENVD